MSWIAVSLLHVPLIIHAPGLKKGRSIDTLTQHIDLAPTVLELLGIKADWGIHGQSLLPIINGEKRKSAIFADGGHEEEKGYERRIPQRMELGRGQQEESAQRTLMHGRQDDPGKDQ